MIASAEPLSHSRLLSQVLSWLLPLAQDLLQQEVEVPLTCQLAVLPPDGDPKELEFLSREDTLSHYHIDGRGKLKNEIGLILGIALSEPPAA